MNKLESLTIEGDSPVNENKVPSVVIFPSSVRHEKFGVNLPGPSGKTKYSFTPIVYSTVRER